MHDEKEIKYYSQTIFDKIRIASAVAVIRTLPKGETPKAYAEKLHNIFKTSWQNDNTTNPVNRKIVADERDKIVKNLCETFSIGDSNLCNVNDRAGEKIASDNEDESLTDSDSTILDDLLLELNAQHHTRSIDHRRNNIIKCQKCANRMKTIKYQSGTSLNNSPTSLDEYKIDLSFIQAIVWLKSAITMMKQVPVRSIQKVLGKHWRTVNNQDSIVQENFKISTKKSESKKGQQLENLINDNQNQQPYFYTFDDDESVGLDDEMSFHTQNNIDFLSNAKHNLVVASDTEAVKIDCANNLENNTDDEETNFQFSPGNEATNSFLNIHKNCIGLGANNKYIEPMSSPEMSFGEECKERQITSAANVEDSGFQTFNVNSITQNIDLKMSELSVGLRKDQDLLLSSIQFADSEKLATTRKTHSNARRLLRIEKVNNFLTIQNPSEFLTASTSNSKMIPQQQIGSKSTDCQNKVISDTRNVNRRSTVPNSEKCFKRKKDNHSKSKSSPPFKKSKGIHDKISSVSLNHVLRTSNTNDVLLQCTKKILCVFENETIVTTYSRYRKWQDSMEKEAVQTIVNLVDLLQEESGPSSCKNETVQMIKRIFEKILNSQNKITISEHHLSIILEFCNSFVICHETVDYLIMRLKDLTDVVTRRMDEDQNLIETLNTLERSCLLFHGLETVLTKYKKMAPECRITKSSASTGIPAVTELWKKRWGTNKIQQNTRNQEDENRAEFWMTVLEKLAVASADNYPQITVLVWQCISILRSDSNIKL